jgi:hypothetical protein
MRVRSSSVDAELCRADEETDTLRRQIDIAMLDKISSYEGLFAEIAVSHPIGILSLTSKE